MHGRAWFASLTDCDALNCEFRPRRFISLLSGFFLSLRAGYSFLVVGRNQEPA